MLQQRQLTEDSQCMRERHGDYKKNEISMVVKSITWYIMTPCILPPYAFYKVMPLAEVLLQEVFVLSGVKCLVQADISRRSLVCWLEVLNQVGFYRA